MTTLKVTDKNIEALTLIEDNHDLKGKKGLNASSVYKLSQFNLSQVRQIVEEEPELKKKLKSHYYGGTALHFALMNPNLEIFKYMVGLYQEEKVPLNQKVKSFRKVKILNQDNLNITEGDTLFNVALALADVAKMEYVRSLGIDEISLPKLPTHHATYEYEESYRGGAEQNALYYCLYLAKRENRNFSSVKERANFFVNFAASFDSIDNMIATDFMPPNRQNYRELMDRKLFESYLLLLCPEAYKSDKFVGKVLPAIFRNYPEYAAIYQNRLLAEPKETLELMVDNVMMYMRAPTAAYNNLKTIIKRYKNVPNQNVMVEKIEAAREKAALGAAISAKTESKASFKL